MKTVQMLYKCADGKNEAVAVSPAVARMLKKHSYKEEWQLSSDKRFCSAAGYVDSESEISVRDIYWNRPTEDAAMDSMNLNELLTVIKSCLTDTQYRRFLTHTLDGVSYAEMADIEGVNESAIRNSIRHVKRKLKKVLQNGYGFGVQNTVYSEGVISPRSLKTE